jgi:hypothetical protein
MKRKDMLIKDLQYKLEHNEGCKYHRHPQAIPFLAPFPPQVKTKPKTLQNLFVMFSDCDENSSR